MAAILLSIGNTLLYIFAKPISLSECAQRHFNGGGGGVGRGSVDDGLDSTKKSPKWRLGTILIIVSSILCFVAIVATMGQ